MLWREDGLLGLYDLIAELCEYFMFYGYYVDSDSASIYISSFSINKKSLPANGEACGCHFAESSIKQARLLRNRGNCLLLLLVRRQGHGWL